MENIQPFSAKDLSIRSLGDRIRDLGQLRNLYPNIPKDQAFGSHYNSEWRGPGRALSWAAHLHPSNAVGGALGLTQVAPGLAEVVARRVGRARWGWWLMDASPP